MSPGMMLPRRNHRPMLQSGMTAFDIACSCTGYEAVAAVRLLSPDAESDDQSAIVRIRPVTPHCTTACASSATCDCILVSNHPPPPSGA